MPVTFREDGAYVLRDGETGETRTLTGKEIWENGLTFAQDRPSGSRWFYEAVK